jgi:hypothetical protein
MAYDELPTDELPDQVPYVAPSVLRMELKQAELREARYMKKIQDLEREVEVLRAINRKRDPQEIPDWKVVFDEVDEQKLAQKAYTTYKSKQPGPTTKVYQKSAIVKPPKKGPKNGRKP